jgi:hypothetical protein
VAAADALAEVTALVPQAAMGAGGRKNLGAHEQRSHQGGSEGQVGNGEVRSRERLHAHPYRPNLRGDLAFAFGS